MPKSKSSVLDGVDSLLLSALELDGRAPLKALSNAIGLSIAATSERLKRLQDIGVVRRISADVDLFKVGFHVKALVAITVEEPGKKAFLKRIKDAHQVIECHHVAGLESYVMTVVCRSLVDLEEFISSVNMHGETRTSIIFSTPIERRGPKVHITSPLQS